MNIEQRFLDKVNKNGPNGCWEWTAGLDRDGYGFYRTSIKDHGVRKQARAHKFLWEQLYGPTNGLYVCHKCDNRKCVNPEHLFLGTNQDNLKDMRDKGRWTHYRKLSLEQIEEIKQEHKITGMSHRALAKKWGISKTHITRIVSS